MMSNPNNVDVDIPNTSETKLVSRKSTENLRHLVHNNSNGSGRGLVPGKHQPGGGGGGAHHEKTQRQIAQGMALRQQQQQRDNGTPMEGVTPIPPTTAINNNNQQHQTHASASSIANSPNQNSQAYHSQSPEYSAWTIGSTEGLQKAAALALSALTNYTASVSSAASIASSASGGTATAAGGISLQSPSVASSVTPPPPPVVQSTLGGLSQNIDPSSPMHHQQQVVSPILPSTSSNATTANGTPPSILQFSKPLQQTYQTRLLSTPSPAVESLLSSSCESLNFDIAEMWLRTGPKTHQLTNSHVRPTALDESVRKQLVDVYYGERSAERTHRLSPALCKRAKEAGDVVWVTAHTVHGAEALKCSISDVRTAVAVPLFGGEMKERAGDVLQRCCLKAQCLRSLLVSSIVT
eukprot:scaffold13361_cov259-Alexandrium_tamarense.AAC.3